MFVFSLSLVQIKKAVNIADEGSLTEPAGHTSWEPRFEYWELREGSVFWNLIWKQVILYSEQLLQRNSYK